MPPLYSATRKQASAYALPGLKYRPTSARGSSWSITRFRCPTVRAAVCDFLPLRPAHAMRLRGWRLFSARTGAIGHRWMYSCVYSVAVSLGCIPNAVGATIGRPKITIDSIPSPLSRIQKGTVERKQTCDGMWFEYHKISITGIFVSNKFIIVKRKRKILNINNAGIVQTVHPIPIRWNIGIR